MRDDGPSVFGPRQHAAQLDRVEDEKKKCNDEAEEEIIVGTGTQIGLVECCVRVGVVEVEIAQVGQLWHYIMSRLFLEHEFQVEAEIGGGRVLQHPPGTLDKGHILNRLAQLIGNRVIGIEIDLHSRGSPLHFQYGQRVFSIILVYQCQRADIRPVLLYHCKLEVPRKEGMF